MPKKVDTKLKSEYREEVIARFDSDVKDKKSKTEDDYFSIHNPDLKKNSYYELVVQGKVKRRTAAEDVLRALGYTEAVFEQMLEHVPSNYPRIRKSVPVLTAEPVPLVQTPEVEPVAHLKLVEREPDTLATHELLSNKPLTATPDATAEGPAPRRLPSPLTDIIGRVHEIIEVVELLGQHRLVTLVGAGGIGKTRLAIAAAERMEHTFKGLIRFVDLSGLTRSITESEEADIQQRNDGELLPVSDSSAVEYSIARQIGARVETGVIPFEALAGCLSASPTLLVIDNCEHVIKSCVHVIRGLLDRCPDLKILATSRERMMIKVEYDYAVPPLELPPINRKGSSNPIGKVSAAQLLEYASVQLFVKRAGHQNWSEAQKYAIAKICMELDGLPLAIEMAAARSRSLSVHEILKNLSQRLTLLRGGRDSLERHETLAALMEWSYALLTESEKSLLNRLSVFRGGWSSAAAEFLNHHFGAKTDTLVELSSLVEKSLVKADTRYEATRYSFLDTVRIYAGDKLGNSGDALQASDAHLAYYTKLASDAYADLYGSDQEKTLQRLSLDYGNLMQALEWSFNDGVERKEQGAVLCTAVAPIWTALGEYSEGRHWCEYVLETHKNGVSAEERAHLLRGAGLLAYHQGDYKAARHYHEESLELSRTTGSSSEIANALQCLGNVENAQGNYAVARKHYEEASNVFAEGKNLWGTAAALNNLAVILECEGDYPGAIECNERSLSIKRQTGDKAGEACSLINLGILAQCQGRYGAARDFGEKALLIYKQILDPRGIAMSLSNIASSEYAVGNIKKSRYYNEESLAIAREIGSVNGIAESLGNLGMIACHERSFDIARDYFNECMAIMAKINDQMGLGITHTHLGRISCAEGGLASARRDLTTGLEIKADIGDKNGMAYSIEAFGFLECEERSYHQAATLLAAAAALREAIGAPLPPIEEAELTSRITLLKQELSDEEFAAATTRGKKMTMGEAVALALG